MDLESDIRKLQPDPLKVQLNGLIWEAESKARIYTRLFDSKLQVILDYAYFATQGHIEPSDRGAANDALLSFENKYNNLRMLEASTIRDYNAFTAIGRIIPRLKATLNSDGQQSYTRLVEEVAALKILGNACMDEVRQLTARIRRFEGMADYNVKIRSPEGPMEVAA